MDVQTIAAICSGIAAVLVPAGTILLALRSQDTKAALTALERYRERVEEAEKEAEEERGRAHAERARADALQKRIDQLEWLLRWWWKRAHTMAHKIISARGAAADVLRKNGHVVPDSWEARPSLPHLSEPLERGLPMDDTGEAPP